MSFSKSLIFVALLSLEVSLVTARHLETHITPVRNASQLNPFSSSFNPNLALANAPKTDTARPGSVVIVPIPDDYHAEMAPEGSVHKRDALPKTQLEFSQDSVESIEGGLIFGTPFNRSVYLSALWSASNAGHAAIRGNATKTPAYKDLEGDEASIVVKANVPNLDWKVYTYVMDFFINKTTATNNASMNSFVGSIVETSSGALIADIVTTSNRNVLALSSGSSSKPGGKRMRQRRAASTASTSHSSSQTSTSQTSSSHTSAATPSTTSHTATNSLTSSAASAAGGSGSDSLSGDGYDDYGDDGSDGSDGEDDDFEAITGTSYFSQLAVAPSNANYSSDLIVNLVREAANAIKTDDNRTTGYQCFAASGIIFGNKNSAFGFLTRNNSVITRSDMINIFVYIRLAMEDYASLDDSDLSSSPSTSASSTHQTAAAAPPPSSSSSSQGSDTSSGLPGIIGQIYDEDGDVVADWQVGPPVNLKSGSCFAQLGQALPNSVSGFAGDTRLTYAAA